MASKAERTVINAAGLVQGIVLVTFPAASTIFTDTSEYGLSSTRLRAQLSRRRSAASPGASALTAAELRVLPLLATHLSAPEIAAELFVSVHTVKSQQASLYRKLETSSRSQAVTRARQLGLLEG